MIQPFIGRLVAWWLGNWPTQRADPGRVEPLTATDWKLEAELEQGKRQQNSNLPPVVSQDNIIDSLRTI